MKLSEWKEGVIDMLQTGIDDRQTLIAEMHEVQTIEDAEKVWEHDVLSGCLEGPEEITEESVA